MRVIDPADVKFVASMKLPQGQYAGRSLCEVAATSDGLMYLDRFTLSSQKPGWISPRLQFAVERFVMQPHIQERVGALYQQPKH